MGHGSGHPDNALYCPYCDGFGHELDSGDEIEHEDEDKGRECSFTVIDTKTWKYPDSEEIALKEDWAKHLIYCDIDGFFIGEDGALILVDDCGKAAWCPGGRFRVIMEAST